MDRNKKKLNQYAKPTSSEGKEVVEMMNASHFHLTNWGLEKVQIAGTDTILDIGCGGGRTVATLAGQVFMGKVYGLDHSPDCVKWAAEYNRHLVDSGRVEIVQGSVEQMPFKDESFHLVVAVETIYFWTALRQSFKEVYRILKPDGCFLVVNEMYLGEESFKERNEKCMATEEMTIYSPAQVEKLMKEAGFRNISTDMLIEKNWLRCLARK
ncbi:MAG TPA: class I SAM-dependent methyltransferase [Firmicutes bacterium]|nr:class I SAM-dependent methyltransferase [Bacillota bacterium]